MSAVILVYAQKKKGDVCAEQIASLRHHLENILTWMGTNKIKNNNIKTSYPPSWKTKNDLGSSVEGAVSRHLRFHKEKK